MAKQSKKQLLRQEQEFQGSVKWFHGDKGYGFITPKVGGRDVFIHAVVARACGIKPNNLQEGVMLEGRFVLEPDGRRTALEVRIVESKPMRGTVRWFNYKKRYGFIDPEGDDNGIFVHLDEVRAAGMDLAFQAGTEVIFTIRKGRKRPEACNLMFAEDAVEAELA